MNDVNYELIGTRIREKREEVGCSQEQLAWDVELSNTYISLVETGKKKPSLQCAGHHTRRIVVRQSAAQSHRLPNRYRRAYE